MFRNHLSDAVGRLWTLRYFFIDGQASRSAIGRARRGKDDFARPNTGAIGQHIQQAKHVDARIKLGIFGRDRHTVLRCLVADDFRANFIKDFLECCLIGDISAVECCFGIEVLFFATAFFPKIIHNSDFMAQSHALIHNV